MKEKYNVGIIGATGMVGQRFATLLENHPWFHFPILITKKKRHKIIPHGVVWICHL